MKPKNIAVDLDGTLIKEDLTYLAVKKLLNVNYLNALRIILWYAIGGRAYLKRKIAQTIDINTKALTYNQNLLDYLQKLQGHNIVLATGADYMYAQKIAAHLDIFKGIVASNSVINMTGANKLAGLVDYFATNDFVYVGNGVIDLKVWEGCAGVITVNVADYVKQKLPADKVMGSFDF